MEGPCLTADTTKLEDIPEDILCGIFSRLPMRDAVRACASCSTLMRVWRRHADLVFDEDTLRLRLLREEELDEDQERHRKDELARDFVRFVDATMSRHRSDTAVDTLTVKFAYLLERHAASVDRWVRFALASTTTRRLELDFLPSEEDGVDPDGLCYDFPCSLLTDGAPVAMALEQLHLRLGCLRPCSTSRLTKIATIVLDNVRISSQDLERFLSSCQNLQRLELKYCDELVYVKVPTRLRHLGFLAVQHCCSVRTVDISESSVTTLRFDSVNRPGLLGSVAPAPSVRNASFHLLYSSRVEPGTDPRFESTSLAHLMPGLESLSLTLSMLIKVVTTSNSSGNKYHHLKRVDIRMVIEGSRRHRDDFIFLHQFLDAAPALESLSLHLVSQAPAFDASRMRPGVDYFRKHPRRPHRSLKTVNITGFDADLAFLELVLYILENALPLQRVSLHPTWNVDTGYAELLLSDQRWSKKMQFAREVIERHIGPMVQSSTSGVVLEIL